MSNYLNNLHFPPSDTATKNSSSRYLDASASFSRRRRLRFPERDPGRRHQVRFHASPTTDSSRRLQTEGQHRPTPTSTWVTSIKKEPIILHYRHNRLHFLNRYMYNQILSVITGIQLDRIFEQRCTYDLHGQRLFSPTGSYSMSAHGISGSRSCHTDHYTTIQ